MARSESGPPQLIVSFPSRHSAAFLPRTHHDNSSSNIWLWRHAHHSMRVPTPHATFPLPAPAPPLASLDLDLCKESTREFNAPICMYRAASSLFFGGACFATSPARVYHIMDVVADMCDFCSAMGTEYEGKLARRTRSTYSSLVCLSFETLII